MSCGKFDADDFADAEGAVCLAHILDPALASKMHTLATERACIVCDRKASIAEPAFAVPFANVLGEIGAVLHRHFASVDDEAVPFDSEDWCYAGADTYQTNEVVANICYGAFRDDVSGELIEKVVGEFPADITWTDTRGADSPDGLDWEWEYFAETVQSRSRFIFVAGGDLADHSRAPTESAAFLGRLAAYVDGELGLIDDLEAGAVFYRGRLMDAPQALKPECAMLQPAPPAIAAANRMSPAGIQMFYASADAQTAIAEIAGHGPEPYALMGAFRSTRGLRVLDLTRKAAFPSLFEEARHAELGLAGFLRSFVDRITQPVIPDGRQHIEYTPTQVLTEYLRWMPRNPIDGIALPSAQTGQKTYVLFFDSKAFADVDWESSGRLPASLAVGRRVDWSPDFTLAKDDIHVYEVRRRYEGVPHSLAIQAGSLTTY
jgi:RES domain/HEPN/RES N-terminal domain 1